MTPADDACSVPRMVQVDFTEELRPCDACGRDTTHRVATITDGPESNSIARCLECPVEE